DVSHWGSGASGRSSAASRPRGGGHPGRRWLSWLGVADLAARGVLASVAELLLGPAVLADGGRAAVLPRPGRPRGRGRPGGAWPSCHWEVKARRAPPYGASVGRLPATLELIANARARLRCPG